MLIKKTKHDNTVSDALDSLFHPEILKTEATTQTFDRLASLTPGRESGRNSKINLKHDTPQEQHALHAALAEGDRRGESREWPYLQFSDRGSGGGSWKLAVASPSASVGRSYRPESRSHLCGPHRIEVGEARAGVGSSTVH